MSTLTPGRHTRLTLDAQAPIVLRPAWSEARTGAQLTRARTAAAASADVVLHPSGHWTLAHHKEDITRLLDEDYGGALGAADFNAAPHWAAYNTWRKPTELTGHGGAANIISSGVPAFRVQTPAGSSWAQELTADVAAVPKPVSGADDFPLDRVLSSIATFPANQAFAVLLGNVPHAARRAQNLFTFYFGGITPGARRFADATPVTSAGYAVNVRGDGALTVYEQLGSDWFKRHSIPPPPIPPPAPSIIVKPVGRRHITLEGPSVLAAPDPLPPAHPLLFGGSKQRPPGTVYTVPEPAVPSLPTESVTGAGQVRLDMRRLLRVPVTIARLVLPPEGVLVDLPFWIPFPIPAATVLTVNLDAWIPAGTSIAVKVFSANNDTELVQLVGNNFQSIAGVQAYYCKFTLSADAAAVQTPALRGYAVAVPHAVGSLAPVTIGGGKVTNLSCTGPDIHPDQDTARLQVQDLKGELALLRARGRIPGQVAVYDDADALVSILHEGEVSLAVGTRRGRTGRWPQNWYEYDVTMVGMWARVAECISLDLKRFIFTTNYGQAWKVTDIIRYCLIEKAGFPAGQVDIPDLDIRLFPMSDGSNVDDFTLQPGVSIAEFLRGIAERYLAMTLIWDANAGAAGMWRLLFNPTLDSPVLASFVKRASGSGKAMTHPGAFPAGTTFIEDKSYREEVKPLEGNYVLVVGVETVLPSKIASAIYNPLSYDFVGATSDPLHIDYLGRFVPIVHVDPTLRNQNATRFVARRIFNFACHGQKWLRFTAPLLLIEDATDADQVRARCLRVQDTINVTVDDGTKRCVVRSANPFVDRHDRMQKVAIEAVVVA